MTIPPEWRGREIADPTGTRYGRLEDVFGEFGVARVSHATILAAAFIIPWPGQPSQELR